jgi:FkbM family methyltransferase
MKRILKKYLPPAWIHLGNTILGRQAHKSYSQYGEDMILKALFSDKKQGFYVDIGAYHPKDLSNTYAFYTSGWRGINIDATSGSMRLFNVFRTRDINLELAVSNSTDECIFYQSDAPSLNTLSKDLLLQRVGKKEQAVTAEIRMKPTKLGAVLDKYLAPGQEIDFISIDVEGMELSVLQSNNWGKYRPHALVIESDQGAKFTLDQIGSDPIVAYLKQLDYKLISVTVANLIFMDRSYQHPL